MADLSTTTNRIGTATTSGFANVELKEYYEKNLLVSLRDNLYLYNLCEHTSLPKNVGDTITWRLFKDLSVPSGELAELDPGAPVNLQIVEFKTQLKQYGSWTEIASKVDDYAIDPIISKTSELLGRQAAEKFEDIIYGVAVTSKNQWYADGATSAATVVSGPKTITVKDLNKIKAYFKKANVKPHSGGKYVAIIAPEIEMDIRNLAQPNQSWIDIAKYAKPDMAYEGEIGEFMGFRWIVSNKVTASSNAVSKCLFLGAEGLGTVSLEGESNAPRIIYKAAGSAGTKDPLNQLCTLGWKNKGFAVRILRDEAVLVYNVMASAVVDTSVSTRTHQDKSIPANRA